VSERVGTRLWTLASDAGRPAAELLSRVGLHLVLEWALWSYLPTAFRLIRLRLLVRELNPAAVVGFGGVTNVMTVMACRGTRGRVVISERNDPDRQVLPTPWNQVRPRIYAEADVVTANTHGGLARLRAWVPAERLRFVPNPVVIPESASTAEPPRGLGRPRVLIVGRLCEQKAHDILLGAMALLPAELHHWRLAVVGQGENAEGVRRVAEQLGVADRVEWHGQVDSPYPFYRFSDIFVLPSRHEGMPNALLEAMSFGLPPIVSDASPGPLEVVRHGDTGLVVPVGDRRALAEAIALLANRPDLRRRLGDNARREVAGYDLDTALSAWDGALGWPTWGGGRNAHG
jgi:glycosyltransferase involved in cell wall biosynthesis